MSDRNELVVRAVLDGARARRASLREGSTERKPGTFYGTCMDSAVDAHDASRYRAALDQGGLGLPDRDYYTSTGAAADSLCDAYVAHVARLCTLAGAAPASARADARRVMALETQLARASLTRVQRRDPAATDHPMSLAQLRALAQGVDWPAYFRAIGLTVLIERVNVAEPEFFRRLSGRWRPSRWPTGGPTCATTRSAMPRPGSAPRSCGRTSPSTRASAGRRSRSRAGSGACAPRTG